MKKKPKSGPKGLAGWYASYADMVTVLMVFFILMFSMSVIDQELFERFMDSFNPNRQDATIMQGADGIPIPGGLNDGLLPGQPPPPPPPPPAPPGEGGYGEEEDGAEEIAGIEGDTVSDMYNAFMTYFAQLDPDGDLGDHYFIIDDEPSTFLRITLPAIEGMLFNSGQTTLLPPAIEALNQIAPILEEFVASGHAILVEGHTDNQPHTPSSNWHLSNERAAAVVYHLMNNWEFPPLSIVGVGLSEYDPIDSNDTPEGRQANRRIEIKVFEIGGGGIGDGERPWSIPGL